MADGLLGKTILTPFFSHTGWTPLAKIQTTLEGRTHDFVDSKLPPTVHPMGEINQAIPRLSAFRMHNVAIERGFGIGSINIPQNIICIVLICIGITESPRPCASGLTNASRDCRGQV